MPPRHRLPRAVRSPLLGAVALALLIGDAAWVGRNHSDVSPLPSTAGRYLGPFMGRHSGSHCHWGLIVFFVRTTTGGSPHYVEYTSWRELDPPRIMEVVVNYDVITSAKGFWAPITITRSRRLDIMDVAAQAPLPAADDALMRADFATWLCGRKGYAQDAAELNLPNGVTTTAYWPGLFHTGAAAACALLSLSLPFCAWRALRTRRLTRRGHCPTCCYSLAGLRATDGRRQCPECGGLHGIAA